jgi:predicted small lipoprotein YifL
MLLGMVCVVMLIAACGKKGPLYLPDKSDAPAKTGEQTFHPLPAQPGTK